MQNLEMNNVNGLLIQFLQIIIVFNTQLKSNCKVSLWLLFSIYRGTMVRIGGTYYNHFTRISLKRWPLLLHRYSAWMKMPSEVETTLYRNESQCEPVFKSMYHQEMGWSKHPTEKALVIQNRIRNKKEEDENYKAGDKKRIRYNMANLTVSSKKQK